MIRIKESRAENAGPVAPAFFRIADVLHMTALSRATLYRRIAEGRFPKPVHLGGRACGWTPTALQAWIDDPQGYRAPRDLMSSSALAPDVFLKSLSENDALVAPGEAPNIPCSGSRLDFGHGSDTRS